MLRYSKLETLGTHEGPGVRFVVFLQGCNYKCIYCHNPETIDYSGGKLMSDDDLINNINNNKCYFGKKGGVTFSGGEPLLQAKQLIPIVKKLKEQNINVAIDTNGSVMNDNVSKLLSMVDLVLLDVKHMDKKWFEAIVDNGYKNAFSVAKYLKENQNLKFWIRYVLVPGFTDQIESIADMGEYFKDFKNLEKIEILPYHTLGEEKYNLYDIKKKYESLAIPGDDLLMRVKVEFEKYFNNVFIR
jgi:pyruvate formate lyase activating enzyme